MKTLFTIAFLMLCVSMSQAAVYYVDNLGNDNNTGLSESSPWKTIGKVNSFSFQAGDQILFKKGGQWYETLTIKQNYITFGAYGTGNLPLIDGQMTRTYNIYMYGRTGVTIQDFNIRNSAGSGGIRIENSNNCVVQNCEIYVTAHGGVFIQNSRNCIVRGHTITTPDYSSAQTDGIYSQRNNGNIYENNYILITNAHTSPHVDGIQCYLDTSITARGNYIEQRNPKTGNAQGIYATNTFGHYYYYNNIINTPNIMSNSLALKNLDLSYKGTIEVYHNTVITHGGNALCIQNAPDFIARNNIFISKGYTYAVNIIGAYNGGNLNYNIYHNDGTDPSVVRLENDGGNHTLAMLQAKGLELNGQYTDPLIGVDFMPLDNSPVIDRGIVISSILVDKNGTVRPQGSTSDLGALEKVTGGTEPLPNVPAAPANLTATGTSTSTIDLAWTDASGNETGFKVERFSGSWTEIVRVGAGVTAYTDNGLNAGTQYSYRVSAFNTDGSSAFSNTASASTEALPPVVYDDIVFSASTGNLSRGSFLTIKQGSIAPQVVQFANKSTAEYVVTIPGDGEWYIQGIFYHSNRSNSFIVQLNGGGKTSFSYNKITNQWAEGPQVPLGYLAAGDYKITVSNVKPGDQSLVDMIYVSNTAKGSTTGKSFPKNTALSNYPNPFNPSTKIAFHVPEAGNVEVSVYNSIGQKVADLINEVKQAGYFEVNWDASNLPSGIYFCTMRTGEVVNTRKMILMK